MTGIQPRISVVIPFYNAERFISECIESLLAQAYPREAYEIILVDNNSTDRSAAIAAEFDGVTLLSEPTAGSYAARNAGIRTARGEIIATIDPDCRADPDWLKQIDCAMQDESCSILLGHQRHGTASESLRLLELYEAEKIAYVTNGQQKELYFGYTNNMAFRKTVFDAIGLFPERTRGGDTIFVRRVVDTMGCNVVRFRPEMRTTHLEVDTVNAYYNKRLIYGQSNERISHVLSFRPLRNGERWTVFKRLAAKHRFPITKKLWLLLLLVPGAVLYESGRRRGMFGD